MGKNVNIFSLHTVNPTIHYLRTSFKRRHRLLSAAWTSVKAGFVVFEYQHLMIKLAKFLSWSQKAICQPQTMFFPIIKVSPQFLIKGISSIKPLIKRIYASVHAHG